MALGRWLLVIVAVAVAGAGGLAILGQAGSGAQPWDSELSDNFIFIKAIPFALGVGVVVGLVRGLGSGSPPSARRASDGAIRRFSPGTVVGHWIAALGFCLALPTGVWQYLGGILDVSLPIPLYVFYRLHYIGATLILYSVGSFATYWWLSPDRSLLPPAGHWTEHLRGLAHELPAALGQRVAKLLRLDLREAPPEVGRFTFYETAFSFPTWTVALALITVTGLVKAMRYVYPVPGPLLFWASTLHVAAMVLIVIKVLDHLRYTLPRWPWMVAMVTTWISERSVRLGHPGWLRAIDRDAISAGRPAEVAQAPATAGLPSGGKP
jgi:cytochrome b subunit of formate dehydrogenase